MRLGETGGLGSGAFAVARYADVSFVLRHPELFSSRAMLSATSGDFASALGSVVREPSEAARIAELLKSLPITIADQLAARSLIAVDPPCTARCGS
jgi:cytochrome P450